MDKVLVHQKGYYGITLFWIVCIYLFIYNPPFYFLIILGLTTKYAIKLANTAPVVLAAKSNQSPPL